MSSNIGESLVQEPEAEAKIQEQSVSSWRRQSIWLVKLKWLWPVAIFVLLACLVVATLCQSTPVQANVSENDSYAPTTIPRLVVDVKGDVLHPGVYTLVEGSRVKDAITRAGGVRHKSDLENVNEAAALDDGSEVIVPGPGSSRDIRLPVRSDETASPLEPSPIQPAASSAQGTHSTSSSLSSVLIDLNTANASTLETIHGIGPVRAKKIIDYRTNHGQFRSLDELKNIRGIGPKLFSQISQFLIIPS